MAQMKKEGKAVWHMADDTDNEVTLIRHWLTEEDAVESEDE
jgi:hypothetical protein